MTWLEYKEKTSKLGDITLLLCQNNLQQFAGPDLKQNVASEGEKFKTRIYVCTHFSECRFGTFMPNSATKHLKTNES